MPLSAEETKLYDWARASLPRWFWEQTRAEEDFGAMLKIFDAARQFIADMKDQGQILTAPGPVSGEPDWLNQHAIDRDTSRANGESDDALRARLRDFTNTVTRVALLAMVGAALDAAGVSSNDFGMIETRAEGAYFHGSVQARHTGAATTTAAVVLNGDGTATISGLSFTGADTGFATQCEPWFVGRYVFISGCDDAANNGRFRICGVPTLTSFTVENAAAVADASTPIAWCLDYQVAAPASAQPIGNFLSRGYRFANSGFTVILPYLTDEATRLSVAESLRRIRAAGVLVRVERRQVP